MAVPIYGGFPMWDEPADPYAAGWQPFNGRGSGLTMALGSGLAGLGAGLLSGRNWSEGLSRGLLGFSGGVQQGMQDARRDYFVDQQGRYMQRRMQQEDKAQARQDAADTRKAQAIADLSAHPPSGVDPQQWASMVAADPEGMASAYGKSLFEPAKPPTVRTFNEGGMAVDKQFNPKTGTWDVLSSAPRWQPAQAPEQWVDVKDAQGNVIGQRSSRSGKYDPYPSAAPKTLEERDQQTLLTGDPGSPEYAMAYTRAFLTPHYVQTDKGVVPIMPAVPPNIRPPTYAASGAPAGGPNGTMPQGGAAIPGTAPPMNQDQANAAGFADRMASASSVLDQLGAGGKPFVPGQVDWTASGLPASNYTTSPQWKQFDQARRNFINAQLRRESGAAISQSEFDNANAQYFPVPNDPPEVLQQKAQNRAQAIANMQRAAGPQYKPDQVSAPAPQQGAAAPAGRIEYRFENGVLVPVTPGAARPSSGAVGRW